MPLLRVEPSTSWFTVAYTNWLSYSSWWTHSFVSSSSLCPPIKSQQSVSSIFPDFKIHRGLNHQPPTPQSTFDHTELFVLEKLCFQILCCSRLLELCCCHVHWHTTPQTDKSTNERRWTTLFLLIYFALAWTIGDTSEWKTFRLYALISLKHDSLPGTDVRTSVNFNGQSAGVGVPWAFVHPVGTHVEDTFRE